MKPTCDNDCTQMGWIEYIITRHGGQSEFHVSIAPDADRDTDILVFNHDIQECHTIGGYNWTWERINHDQ